ncbi:hypothetical protein V3G70_29510, partial [Escherichia coli]
MRRERIIRPGCEVHPRLKIIFILARALISDINKIYLIKQKETDMSHHHEGCCKHEGQPRHEGCC